MKRFAAFAAALLLMLPLTGCAGKGSGKTLTIGALPSIDVMPFVIAEQQGYFKKYGVNVKLELFKSSKDRDAAFQAGTLDGMCCDEISIFLYQNAGTDLRITGMTEGEYLLVAGKDSGIKSMADLKGKTVAISEKTLIEYSLDTMLAKNNMSGADVQKTAIPAVPTRLEMLNSGKVDAALLPEPFGSLALKDGAVELSRATKIGLYPSVIGMDQNLIDASRPNIAAFYKAYNDAADYLNSNPVSKYEDLVIKTVGYPEDMRGQIKLPKFEKNRLPLQGDLEAVRDWAVAKGLCKADIPTDKLVEVVR